MNYIDLFSGIGGFALGAYWAGMKFEHHYFSEVEPYCVELYQKRFPDAIPLGDIRGIDCEKLADTKLHGSLAADGEGKTPEPQKQTGENGVRESQGGSGIPWIITGGFPCQDISVAGKGAGIKGSRSGLWTEYWRIIREIRPRYAIIENVSALTFRGLDRVFSDLASIGYDAEWQDIRAEDMGAPHRRERIWIVAYPQRIGLEGVGAGRVFSSREGVFTTSNQGQTEECKRASNRNHWSIEPNVGRLAHGIPRRVDRLRGLGNAILPQIAEMLFRQILGGECE